MRFHFSKIAPTSASLANSLASASASPRSISSICQASDSTKASSARLTTHDLGRSMASAIASRRLGSSAETRTVSTFFPGISAPGYGVVNRILWTFRRTSRGSRSALLARRREPDFGPFLDCRAQIPGVAGEEHGHAVVVLGAGPRVLDAEAVELGRVVGVEPARRLKGCAVEAGREVVFGSEPRLEHVELQRADDADNPVAAGKWLEDAGHPLLGQLLEGVFEMLRLHRVVDLDPLQDLGREIRDAGDTDRLTFGQGVADPEAPVVGDADDVAGPGLLGEVALAGEEKHRGLHRHLAPGADVLQFHAAFKAAGGDAHKSDAVAVLRVDIGLHLEHEAGDLSLLGRDGPRPIGAKGRLRPRRRRQFADPAQ